MHETKAASQDSRGYQATDFEVAQAAGRVVERLECLLDTEGRPEKLLIQLAEIGWAECYLDAWLGFWRFVDDDALAAIRADYEGHVTDEVGARLALSGLTLRSAVCSRSSEGTSVELRFDTGTLILAEVDGKDHASPARLDWRAVGQQGIAE